MTIGLIDIESGNLKSLESALKRIDVQFKKCMKPDDFNDVSKIILPGVGAFPDFMMRLEKKNLINVIKNKCSQNIPFLGICAGFQILFSRSNEHNNCEGLNMINGSFKHFNEKIPNLRTPHVGWNNCKILKKNYLFETIEDGSDFYFDHSYYLETDVLDYAISLTDNGFDFISAINSNNLYGVQFHPEKSQESGLKILKNFSEKC